ncbi:alpha/beta hydrolase [Betaproteobacteria bacterium]|nr:alpha/beta hydrolase [Betaproteobacteria bacterium]GHU47796.1 alpha/beta hydrolase [Betaproteobacteria bacterium]
MTEHTDIPLHAHQRFGREILYTLPPKGVTPHPTPLLFLHGAFAGAWMWADNFLPWFARQGYRSYALSLRGHGGSDDGAHLDVLSIADYVEDTEIAVTWLREQHDQPPALIGHSMGGFVVQKYLENNRAQAAALLCAVPPQGLLMSQFNLLAQRPGLLMDLNKLLSGEDVNLSTVREALFAQPVDNRLLEHFRSHMQLESQRALWDMSLFNLPLLPAVLRPPLLVVGAEKDALVPAFLVEATARTYSLEAHIFKGMGHAVTHEKDWMQVAELLKGWLDETLE